MPSLSMPLLPSFLSIKTLPKTPFFFTSSLFSCFALLCSFKSTPALMLSFYSVVLLRASQSVRFLCKEKKSFSFAGKKVSKQKENDQKIPLFLFSAAVACPKMASAIVVFASSFRFGLSKSRRLSTALLFFFMLLLLCFLLTLFFFFCTSLLIQFFAAFFCAKMTIPFRRKLF